MWDGRHGRGFLTLTLNDDNNQNCDNDDNCGDNVFGVVLDRDWTFVTWCSGAFVPYLKNPGLDELSASVQQQFLIEYYGEGGANPVCCGNGIPGYSCQLCDNANNTYTRV